jgi:hypothetical protein
MGTTSWRTLTLLAAASVNDAANGAGEYAALRISGVKLVPDHPSVRDMPVSCLEPDRVSSFFWK